MIAHARTHPRHATVTCFFDGQIYGMRNNQVPHGIVAIDNRRAWHFMDNPNVRIFVNAASTNSFDVLRQPDHTMPVRTL